MHRKPSTFPTVTVARVQNMHREMYVCIYVFQIYETVKGITNFSVTKVFNNLNDNIELYSFQSWQFSQCYAVDNCFNELSMKTDHKL